MKRWALVRGGTVLSVFDGADDPKTYPDIAEFLVEVGAEVTDNMKDDGKGAYAHPAPEAPDRTQTILERLSALSEAELSKLIAVAKAK